MLGLPLHLSMSKSLICILGIVKFTSRTKDNARGLAT